jgi:hypothetical protein
MRGDIESREAQRGEGMTTTKEILECYKWANDLKVGDVVFVSSRNSLSKSIVTKLTATQIVVGDHDCRYQRRTLSRRIDSWSSDDLRQNTPELEAQYQRNLLIKRIFELTHYIENSVITRNNLKEYTDEELLNLCAKLQGIVGEVRNGA